MQGEQRVAAWRAAVAAAAVSRVGAPRRPQAPCVHGSHLCHLRRGDALPGALGDGPSSGEVLGDGFFHGGVDARDGLPGVQHVVEGDWRACAHGRR